MSLDYFTNLSERLSIITESSDPKPHLPHYEDCVFEKGSNGVKDILSLTTKLVNDPRHATIKYDGSIALVFGCGNDNKFIVCDKWAFDNGKGKSIYSPQDLMKYDLDRNKNRDSLYPIINNIWNGLHKSYGNQTGYYWGDLLYGNSLTENDGIYSFKGNHRGITYKIDSNSELGQSMKNKVGAIVVHQYIPPNSSNTGGAISLNGGIGKLSNNSNVLILSSGLPNVNSKLSIDNNLVNMISNLNNTHGKTYDDLLRDSGMNGLFQTFINKKVRTGNLSNLLADFNNYVNVKCNDTRKKWISDNKNGVVNILKMWSMLYRLKMGLWSQLEKLSSSNPIVGYLDDGRKMQEGYVVGDYKIINRADGFSRQNLNNQ